MADVTGTTIVQPPAGIDPPFLNVRVPAPATAVTLPAAHVPERVAGVPRTRSAGSVSTKSALRVSATAFTLPSVSMRDEFAPRGMETGANAFDKVGGARTCRTAVEGTVLFPTVVLSARAAIVFVYVAGVEDVTSTWMEQPPFAGRAPPF